MTHRSRHPKVPVERQCGQPSPFTRQGGDIRCVLKKGHKGRHRARNMHQWERRG